MNPPGSSVHGFSQATLLECVAISFSRGFIFPTQGSNLWAWCWSWSSSILVIWCKQLTHWKRPWCWERLRIKGEDSIRWWDGWLALLMQWTWTWANFPGGSEVKASASNVGDQGSVPGSRRSPGEGNGNPLQYSCLENPMDRGAW